MSALRLCDFQANRCHSVNVYIGVSVKAAFLTAGLCVAAVTGQSALTNKVLIIGLDGTMPSALAVARTPNLDALKSNGCYSVRVVSHPITHSAASWSSMFTGV